MGQPTKCGTIYPIGDDSVCLCSLCPIKRTIRLYVQLLSIQRLGRATNRSNVVHLVYYTQRTDCHYQHFYRNVNDDLQ